HGAVCSKVVINENVPSVFVVEALAYIQSVHLGLDLGLMKVEIEGGALSIIRKLWREYDDKFKIGAYIRDGKWPKERGLMLSARWGSYICQRGSGKGSNGRVSDFSLFNFWCDRVGEES
ncbi:hypothetical protein Goarm_016752, partial [Gossypium armourianum]|nr:hypothetical protein [Gossypium armourianum]